jgi:tetrahedral aminopeptidase
MSERQDHSDLVEILKELSEAFGVSGFEEEVREKIRARVGFHVDEVHVDPLGNLHAVINPDAPFTLMLDAHMDEVGFVVKSIDEGGFLRLAPMGGWDVRIIPGQNVVVRGPGGRLSWGVVGSLPPHVQEGKEKDSPLAWKDLFVDVGARNSAEIVERGIRVGSPALIPQPFRLLDDGTILGKALDDRAGCAVLIWTLAALSEQRPEFRVVATFSSSEEVGCRGARVAAQMWEPHMAIVIEGTMATDTPGVRADQRVSSLGKGPVITAVDKSLIVPEGLVERILRLARTLDIPHQIKTPLVGSTNGGAIQLTSRGVLTSVIAVPCRYIHSPTCVMRLEDLLHTQRLVETFVREAQTIYREIQA